MDFGAVEHIRTRGASCRRVNVHDCIWNKYWGTRVRGAMELLLDLNVHPRVLRVTYCTLQHLIFF